MSCCALGCTTYAAQLPVFFHVYYSACIQVSDIKNKSVCLCIPSDGQGTLFLPHSFADSPPTIPNTTTQFTGTGVPMYSTTYLSLPLLTETFLLLKTWLDPLYGVFEATSCGQPCLEPPSAPPPAAPPPSPLRQCCTTPCNSYWSTSVDRWASCWYVPIDGFAPECMCVVAQNGMLHLPSEVVALGVPTALDPPAYSTVAVSLPLSIPLHAALKFWLSSKGVDASKSCAPCDGYVTGGSGTVVSKNLIVQIPDLVATLLSDFGIEALVEEQGGVRLNQRTCASIEAEHAIGEGCC